MGLELGILGPISWRLAYERRIILGRIGEHLRILTAEKAERISEEEAPELISPPEREGPEDEEGKAAAEPSA